jgi:hypothetical protein
MKTTITLTCYLVIVTSCFSLTNAQNFKNKFTLSAIGGVNISNPNGLHAKKIRQEGDKDHTITSRKGIHLGINGAYNIHDDISIGMGLIYSQKGCLEIASDSRLQINLNYLDIPLSVAYKKGPIYGLIGPNFSILMSDKYLYRYSRGSNEIEESLSDAIGILAGYQIGIGLEGKRIGILGRLVRTGKSTNKDSFTYSFVDDQGYSYTTIMLGLTFNIMKPSID